MNAKQRLDQIRTDVVRLAAEIANRRVDARAADARLVLTLGGEDLTDGDLTAAQLHYLREFAKRGDEFRKAEHPLVQLGHGDECFELRPVKRLDVKG